MYRRPFYGYRRTGSVPSRYRGRFRRSGYYGRYTRGAQYSRVRRGLQIEKKFFDTSNTWLFDATTEVPATGQLNLIPQGVTESTRVGRKCQIKSIQVKGTATYIPGTDTIGSVNVWLYLIKDSQANGAAAAVTDVFTGTDSSRMMVNLANSERFRIVRKWMFKLQAGAGVAGAFGRDEISIDEYIKLNMPVEFSSTTGAITEIKSNNLFFIAGSDATGATDDEVAWAGTTRVRFTDI